MKNKRLAALILVLIMVAQLAVPVFAQETVIYIKDADDLITLSESCRLDTWSVGKRVVLEADISLEGVAFTPIPTFGGIFDGNGHTVSGIELLGGSTPAGMFGTLQKTAVVKNLTVKALIAPAGDANTVGGIVGENHGAVMNCRFEGTVTGKANIGGIAGLNSADGAITECSVTGVIIGENMTGGIAGQNLGLITACENKAQVNTVSIDPTIKLEDLNGDFLLDISKWTSLGTSVASMDTGGIAGYSSGSILSCVNRGEIGYPHIGYNVGGIAGRSCGFISNCENSALIHGRKDVGGITGQMEPNIALNLSDDTIAELEAELEELKKQLIDLKNSGVSAAGNVNNRIDTILSYLDGATQSAQSLGQASDSYVGAVTNEFNRVSLILADVMKQLEGIAGQVTALFDTLTSGLSQLETAMAEFAVAAKLTEESLGYLNEAIDELEAASEDAEFAAEQIQSGIADLENALSLGDAETVSSALAQIRQGLAELSTASQKTADAMGTIHDLISDSEAMPEDAISAVGALKTALEEAAAALKTIADGIAALPLDPEEDTEAFDRGMQSIRSGFASLSSAIAHFENAAKKAEQTLEKVEEASGQIVAALNSLSEAMGIFANMAAQLSGISESVEGLLHSVNANAPVQIPEKNPDIQNSAEDLFANINFISDELKALNKQIDTYGQEAVEKMDAITSKFEAVVELALEIAGQTLNPDTNDIISDTSDADIEAVTAGKVYGCTNTGTVEGDLNVGGITGTMAIEYELDPEDDLTSSVSGTQQRMYEMKAIVLGCANSGTVTAKRSYVGGIVGQMNLGLAKSCENYGAVTSENGDYVGGIAGVTGAKIQASFVKCSLSGRKYVGGITGSGVAETLGGAVSSISHCYSMVEILGSQYLGAVSGGNSGTFSSNFFVSDTLAGINGISYTGLAEPMAYYDLLKVEKLPENFGKMTVQFVAGGEVLQTILVGFGDSLDENSFPAIPEKEGYYSAWDHRSLSNIRFDTVICAVYIPYVTALPSTVERANGRPIFFAQGAFDSSDTLEVKGMPCTKAAFAQIPNNFWNLIALCFTDDVLYWDVVEQWELTIPTDESSTHTLRYLAPNEKASNLAVFIQENGQWKQIEAKTEGSYLSFNITGSQAQIAVLSTVSIWWVWLIPIGLLLLLILMIVYLVRHFCRDKSATKKAEDDSGTISEQPEPIAPTETAPQNGDKHHTQL